MTIEHPTPEALSGVELDGITTGRPPTPAQIAVQNARRAADHAVMAIFELAFVLQSLDEIIVRYNAETERHLAEFLSPGEGSA